MCELLVVFPTISQSSQKSDLIGEKAAEIFGKTK